jgi:Rrf2 family transcriptional regulator, iron-sulfur cluster assembly transcription factor
MRMSTKGRFAVNAMIDLALREHAGPVALATIGARQQVSMSYLEQLFSRLRREGLVESTRGPGGGYTLGRSSDAITVAQIISAVDDAVSEAGVGAGSDDECLSRDLWQRLSTVVLNHMGTITLRTLVDEQTAKGVSVEARPVRRPAVSPVATKPVRTNAPNSVFAFGRSFAS